MNSDPNQTPSPEFQPNPPAQTFEPNPAPLAPVAAVTPEVPAAQNYSQMPPQPTVQQFQPVGVQTQTNPGHIVLQWLTYALWGWTVLATSLLVVTVISNLLNDTDSGSFTTYGIAAVLVLLPFSVIADVLYSRVEQTKKQGPASIVMVIHAVIFGLFGIGSLIAAVISLVILATSGGDNSASVTALLSSIIIFILYVATFIRTLNLPKLAFAKRLYIIFMVAVIGLISVLGIVGPVAKERSTRNDRLITDNVSSVTEAINGYSRKENKLPTTLSDLDVTNNAKALVDSGLLSYTPNIQPPKIDPIDQISPVDGISKFPGDDTPLYYEICATFKEKSRNSYSSSNYDSNQEYSSYLYIDNHPAGKTCYKLSTRGY